MIETYCGDFDLGSNARNVDILGYSGAAVSARAGYLKLQGDAEYRVMTIILPIIINDVWAQVG